MVEVSPGQRSRRVQWTSPELSALLTGFGGAAAAATTGAHSLFRWLGSDCAEGNNSS